MRSLILLLLLLTVQFSGFAQAIRDSVFRRHNIKLDITSQWLYRNAMIFSYEMAVNPSQSFAVSFGPQNLPNFNLLDLNLAVRTGKSTGFKLGGEYRFYLKKENKHPAPHGVYVGPYVSYLGFHNTKNISYNNNGVEENLDLDLRLEVLNMGAQLGYQFAIKNRITVDLVFIGPSVSKYRARARAQGDFSIDPDEVTNELLLALLEKYPGLGELVEVDEELTSNGRLDQWAYGFRYQIHVGYLFGLKKFKKT